MGEIVHGREARIMPLPGDRVGVIFLGNSPLPDYDVQGYKDDVSIGEFIRTHAAEMGSEEIEAIPIPVIRKKISRDYGHVADAIVWREKEGRKKIAARERGALYLLENEAAGTWAIWLETWSDYFNRSHVFISNERHALNVQKADVVQQAALKAAVTERAKREMKRPSTWITLIVVAAFIVFELFRIL